MDRREANESVSPGRGSRHRPRPRWDSLLPASSLVVVGGLAPLNPAPRAEPFSLRHGHATGGGGREPSSYPTGHRSESEIVLLRDFAAGYDPVGYTRTLAGSGGTIVAWRSNALPRGDGEAPVLFQVFSPIWWWPRAMRRPLSGAARAHVSLKAS